MTRNAYRSDRVLVVALRQSKQLPALRACVAATIAHARTTSTFHRHAHYNMYSHKLQLVYTPCTHQQFIDMPTSTCTHTQHRCAALPARSLVTRRRPRDRLCSARFATRAQRRHRNRPLACCCSAAARCGRSLRVAVDGAQRCRAVQPTTATRGSGCPPGAAAGTSRTCRRGTLFRSA
jgi:hypothetical protein